MYIVEEGVEENEKKGMEPGGHRMGPGNRKESMGNWGERWRQRDGQGKKEGEAVGRESKKDLQSCTTSPEGPAFRRGGLISSFL